MCEILQEAKRRRNKIQKAVISWASSNMRNFPWRKERDPYKTLVTEILLRRTTASAVFRIYEKFFARYSTIDRLANAEEEELKALLSTIGYHVQRAKILKEISTFLVQKYGGEIPRTLEELLKIPHVGPYISRAILSFCYGVPAAVVDSNVERIIRRMFSNHLTEKAPLKLIQKIADTLVPKREHTIYNFGLLDLGALVCRYGSPSCIKCPLRHSCDYGHKQFTMNCFEAKAILRTKLQKH